MKKRFKMIIMLVLSVLICSSIIALCFSSLHEPTYLGKGLTCWLVQKRQDAVYHPSDVLKDENAIRQIGTNAIPFLLKTATIHNSRLKEKILSMFSGAWRFRLGLSNDYDKYKLARDGFHILGSIGEPAVPQLINYLNDPNLETQTIAIDLLGSIGPAAQEAVPILIGQFKKEDANFQGGIIIALGLIHMRAELVVPFLIEQLNNPSTSKINRIAVFIALADYGKQAINAIPTIQKFVNDPDSPTRNYAKNALDQIDSTETAKKVEE